MHPLNLPPYLIHSVHYAIAGAPAPDLEARKVSVMATLNRKSEFADLGKMIDDLYFSIAMLEQADVVEIDLLSNGGKFSPYRIPGGLLEGPMKDFLRARMEEKINSLKSEVSSKTTVYEVVPDEPVPAPAPAPEPAPAPQPDPATPPAAPVEVPVVDPNAGPTPTQ